ncbi:hypothetical protein HYT53_01640 [Candidatus Woesearchaeota archaeon]|nr:hypothetical protein [Candidatus Woesearchaeota archaeon]
MADTEYKKHKRTLDKILAVEELPTHQEVLELESFEDSNHITNPQLNVRLFGAPKLFPVALLQGKDTLLWRERIYNIETVEFVDALAREIAELNLDGEYLEVAAGRGKLSYWLRQKGIPIRATDLVPISEYVEQLEACLSLSKYSPAFVLTSWLPQQCGLQKRVVETESVRAYIDIRGDYPGISIDDSGIKAFTEMDLASFLVKNGKKDSFIFENRKTRWHVTTPKKLAKLASPAAKFPYKRDEEPYTKRVWVWKRT